MPKKYELILFDVDGTLLDTSPGIFNSVRYAEKMMGFKPIPESQLSKFLGPPPKQMYKVIYDISDDIAFAAAKYHREYSKERAIYEASLYPEVDETLAYLKIQGYILGVSTLKPESVTNSILKYYGIKDYFDKVVGMNFEETRTKSITIDIAVESTGCEKTKCLMVGDSEYDLEGARESGIDFLGVSYGFGLKDYKSDRPLVSIISEIIGYLI